LGVAAAAGLLELAAVRILVAAVAAVELDPLPARRFLVALRARDLRVLAGQRVAGSCVVEPAQPIDRHLPFALPVAGETARAETASVRVLVAAAARGGQAEKARPPDGVLPRVALEAALQRVIALERPAGLPVIELLHLAARPADELVGAPVVLD